VPPALRLRPPETRLPSQKSDQSSQLARDEENEEGERGASGEEVQLSATALLPVKGEQQFPPQVLP